MSYSDFNPAPRRTQPRWLRWIGIIILVLVLLPYVIAPLYRFITPISTPMLWRYATGQRVVRIVTPLESISAALPAAVIAAEDQRFCAHGGIDWSELRQAIEDAEDIEDLRGGSTITQQTVKNLFLWPGRSYVRKALEFPLSIWVDLVLPKRRIMELYLNVAEWGPNGEFGVEAGSRRAFNKSARDLGYGEAALLTAILPNPIVRNARQPGPAVRRLAGIYERRAIASGGLSACIRRGRTP
jgi:monofunctional biosynthetic peptidoglycan transglycosylase